MKERDEEKEEVRKYQQQKYLEYTIYDMELHDAQQKILEVSTV